MRVKWKSVLIAAALLMIPAPGNFADAASKNIRVALYIDNGQGYRGVIPNVTLSSSSGLEITLTDNKESAKLPTASEDSARFTVDDYYYLVAETTDRNEAQRVAQMLSQRKLDASIQVQMDGGSPSYQVVSGAYASPQLASPQSKTIAQATGIQPALKGPLHLEADRFSSLKEAQDWETAFELSGVPAHTVLVPQDDKTKYAVWIGNEASEGSLASVQALAKSAFPNFSYKKPNTESYVMLEKDLVVGAGNKDTISKYAFSPQSKLTVAPKKAGATPLITVEEREHRQYRGSIELSQYRGFLTVINELPTEQYLYGVVGSEMVTGWPLEALKTQAVLARTLALRQGNKYGIANVSDTVFEQAYYGYKREAADVRKAVDQTEGYVITYKGKLAEPLYYSNAGGQTSDGSEVWGNEVPYLKPVDSDDSYPQNVAPNWYQVSLQDGTIGYVRADFVTLSSDLNPMGLQTGTINTNNLNFRSGPSTTYHKVLTTLPSGTEVTILSQESEENAYSWTRGPFTPEEIGAMVNASQDRNKAPRINGEVETLRVTKRGPSGRVIEMEANGRILAVSSPDAHRSIFNQGGSLRSTKFDVVEMGTITVLGANGKKTTYPDSHQELLAVAGSEDFPPAPPNGFSDQFLLYSGHGEWRVASKQQAFLFKGNGFGHGLGVSQFGAKAMAENGYDYKDILQHYYSGIKIERK